MGNSEKIYLKKNLSNKSIFFNEGIIGFDHIKNYVFLDFGEFPFYRLYARDDHSSISFFIIKIQFLFENYHLNVNLNDLKSLKFNDELKENEMHDFLIVNVTDYFNLTITANFLAPIIINTKKLLGKQVLSLNSEFHTKHPISYELSQLKTKNKEPSYVSAFKKT